MSDTPYDTDACPDCGGSGELWDAASTVPRRRGEPSRSVLCRTCDGKGWVWIT